MYAWHLVEVRVRFRFSLSIEIVNVDQLKVEGETRISHPIVGPKSDMRQVTKLLVSPVVQLTQAG